MWSVTHAVTHSTLEFLSNPVIKVAFISDLVVRSPTKKLDFNNFRKKVKSKRKNRTIYMSKPGLRVKTRTLTYYGFHYKLFL